jgi:hypothetical protein
MAFNIRELQSEINRGGIVKQSNFEMIVNSPTSNGSRALTARIDSAELPGRSIQTANLKYFGALRKVGYDVFYPEITASIILNSTMQERLLFTRWQDLIINNHARNFTDNYQYELGYYDRYVGTITLNQYSNDGAKIYSVVLREAYPVLINALPVNWGSEDIHRLTVTFTYRHWVES